MQLVKPPKNHLKVVGPWTRHIPYSKSVTSNWDLLLGRIHTNCIGLFILVNATKQILIRLLSIRSNTNHSSSFITHGLILDTATNISRSMRKSSILSFYNSNLVLLNFIFVLYVLKCFWWQYSFLHKFPLKLRLYQETLSLTLRIQGDHALILNERRKSLE